MIKSSIKIVLDPELNSLSNLYEIVTFKAFKWDSKVHFQMNRWKFMMRAYQMKVQYLEINGLLKIIVK